MNRDQSPPRKEGLFADERGDVFVEYISVWAFTIVGGSFAIISLGPEVLAAWELAKTVLLAARP
jgi:hypothetical protein